MDKAHHKILVAIFVPYKIFHNAVTPVAIHSQYKLSKYGSYNVYLVAYWV